MDLAQVREIPSAKDLTGPDLAGGKPATRVWGTRRYTVKAIGTRKYINEY